MTGHLALAEAMRRQGSTPQQAYSLPRQATISSYDPNAHAVKVMLQPEDIESNWMPLGAIGVGNGWGIVCGPQIGDQVQVIFSEGDFHSGVATGRVFSTAATPPPVPAGETWLVHKTGSYLKLHNDGSVELHTAQNLTATVAGDANVTVAGTINSQATQWNHTGPVSIIGTLNVKNTITGTGGIAITTAFGSAGGSAASITGNIAANNGTFNGTSWDFSADGYSLKIHHHGGVTTGAGNTGSALP